MYHIVIGDLSFKGRDKETSSLTFANFFPDDTECFHRNRRHWEPFVLQVAFCFTPTTPKCRTTKIMTLYVP